MKPPTWNSLKKGRFYPLWEINQRWVHIPYMIPIKQPDQPVFNGHFGFHGMSSIWFFRLPGKHVELVELGSVHWAKTSKNMAPKKQQNSPATSPQKGLTPHFRIHGFSQKPTKKTTTNKPPILIPFPGAWRNQPSICPGHLFSKSIAASLEIWT